MAPKRQFSLSLDSLSRLSQGTNSSDPLRSQPEPAVPTLDQVLSELGPLPPEALFLGVASDGLPVLLNLHNPHPGPMLVIGEAGAGKTAFLKCIARALGLTHTERDLQYGVVTSRVKEWENVKNTGHRAGVFEADHNSAQDFIHSLASWAHSNKNTTQSVLLLVDDLEAAAKMDPEALQDLRWLMLRGPSRRVWPILTLSAERYGQVLAWIEIFRTRIFGRVADLPVAKALGGDETSGLDRLEPGVQFSLRENDGWLQFWLPSF